MDETCGCGFFVITEEKELIIGNKCKFIDNTTVKIEYQCGKTRIS